MSNGTKLRWAGLKITLLIKSPLIFYRGRTMRFVEEGQDALKAQLEESRKTILSRLNKIEEDRTKKKGPLDPDYDEQAVELQNEQVLEQLDRSERIELQKINSAIDRLQRGTYGQCVSCGDEIHPKRLKAMPTATQCMDCAERLH